MQRMLFYLTTYCYDMRILFPYAKRYIELHNYSLITPKNNSKHISFLLFCTWFNYYPFPELLLSHLISLFVNFVSFDKEMARHIDQIKGINDSRDLQKERNEVYQLLWANNFSWVNCNYTNPYKNKRCDYGTVVNHLSPG